MILNFIVLFVVCFVSILPAANSTIANLPANTWYEVPNSHMADVKPSGWTANIIGPWGGGIYDTKRNRLVLWGGGHADYYGNELYAFDVPTLKWERLTDPTPNAVPDQEVNPDGTPNSRHTYGGLAYISHADRFFGLGGSLSGVGFAECNRTWTFDFDAEKWTNRNPSTTPTVGFNCYAAYDPEGKRIWWQGGGSWGGLWSYQYDSNAWAKHNSDHFGGMPNAVDTKRGLLFSIGNGGGPTGGVVVYDIRNSNYKRDVWATTGGDAFVAQKAMGLAYDPVADRIVGWNGSGVYVLNPDTKVWTVNNAPGEPTATSTGVYGRWRYIPEDNAFITVNSINWNVFFYKLTAGGGSLKQSSKPALSSGKNKLAIYPNPFRGNSPLTFSAATGTIRLYDVNGKGAATIALKKPGKVSPGTLPAGVYLAEWENNGKVLGRSRFMVAK